MLIFEVIFKVNIKIFHSFGIRKGKDPDPNNMEPNRESGRYGTLSILSVAAVTIYYTWDKGTYVRYNVLSTRYRSCMEHGLCKISGLQVIQTPVAMVDTVSYSTHLRVEYNLGMCFIVHSWTWGLNLLCLQDTTLYCCDGPMLLSKMFVGLLFPHLQGN